MAWVRANSERGPSRQRGADGNYNPCVPTRNKTTPSGVFFIFVTRDEEPVKAVANGVGSSQRRKGPIERKRIWEYTIPVSPPEIKQRRQAFFYFCIVISFLNMFTISVCFSWGTVPSWKLVIIFIAGLPFFVIPQNVSMSRGNP